MVIHPNGDPSRVIHPVIHPEGRAGVIHPEGRAGDRVIHPG
jgi:hypothetical protein